MFEYPKEQLGLVKVFAGRMRQNWSFLQEWMGLVKFLQEQMRLVRRSMGLGGDWSRVSPGAGRMVKHNARVG